MKDTYRTIAEASMGEFKDRGSKFIAYAFPAYTEQQWQDHLLVVKKEHNKARHHCYAYRLGLEGELFRANDDGEPSGTAGRPILGQIDSFELTNVFIVVVRYFGGTKLGTSGLINAYRQSSIEALKEATIIEKIVGVTFRLEFDYSIMSEVMNSVKKMDLTIQKQVFENTGMLEILIRKSEVKTQMIRLKALILGKSIEEIESMVDELNIAGLKITEIEEG